MHTTKTKNKIHYKGCPVCGASSAAIQINSRMFEVYWIVQSQQTIMVRSCTQN